MKLMIVILLMVLCGCQTSAPLTKCHGQAFGLNTTHWQPNADDLKACSQIVQRR